MLPLPAPGPGEVLVTEALTGRYAQEVRAGSHAWVADEPESIGGDDAGPGPFEMLGAALGACVSMTLRMYAERKQWPLAQVAVLVRRTRVMITDEHGQPGTREKFTCTLTLDGDLSDEQRARLVEIADRCPVHRVLERGALFDTRLAQ